MARAYIVQGGDTWASIALAQLGNATLGSAIAGQNGYNATSDPPVGVTIYLTVDESIAPAPAGIVRIRSFLLAVEAAEVDFRAIPGTFRALVLDFNARATSGAGTEWLYGQFNGDAGAKYDSQFLEGLGIAASAAAAAAQAQGQMGLLSSGGGAAGEAGSGRIFLPDYAGEFIKTAATVDIQGGTRVSVRGVRWRASAGVSINRIRLFPAAGNFAVGSSFALYAQS